MGFVKVLEKIPSKITAGDSVSWKISLSDYPASESWALAYTLVKSDELIEITGTADGDDHLIEISKNVSAAYQAGDYSYQAHVSNNTERYMVDSGSIEILPDFAEKTDGYDARDWIDTAIDALEASIQGRASLTQIQQSIGGVEIQHLTPLDQLKILDSLKARKLRRDIKSGKITNTVKVKF